jgi:ATP-binding cassette subfamily B protein
MTAGRRPPRRANYPGDEAPPQPSQPVEPLFPRLQRQARDVRRAFGNTPRSFELVWACSPRNTIYLGLLTVVQALMPAAQAWAGKLIVDGVVGAVQSAQTGREGLLEVAPYLLFEFALIFTSTLASQLRTLVEHQLHSQLTNYVSGQIIRKALSLDLGFFEDPAFYDKLQNARRQADWSALRIVQDTFFLMQQVITLASLTVILVRFSPWLALIFFGAAVPSFIAQSRLSQLTFRTITWRAPESRLLRYIEELLTSVDAVKEVRLFSLGETLLGRYQQLFWKFYREDHAIAVKRTWASIGLGLLTNLVYYASYAWIVLKTIQQEITLGDMTMYIGVFRQAQNSFRQLFDGLGRLYENNLFMDNLFDYLELQPVMPVAIDGTTVHQPIQQGIEFRNVSFRYPGRSDWALRDVSFRIAPHERIALVGLNGAGKTTLVKLLVRLYDPTEGQVLLDGVDLREYDLNSLRENIAVLFQDFVRYQFTARENIGFGQIESVDDLAAIISAAERSGARPIIESLPRQYETPLGRRWENGHELSGGEWQKVALGRAFMRDAQVLVLDEPTASLDAEAEYEIFRRFGQLTAGRIAVFISHRFSTVRMADRILVLQDGRIIESGSHRELVHADGAYAHLFELQAEGYR